MKRANVYALVIVSVVFLLFCALFSLASAQWGAGRSV